MLLVAPAPLLSGCDLIEGIFKVGFWAGIIIVVLIVLVIGGLVRLFR